MPVRNVGWIKFGFVFWMWDSMIFVFGNVGPLVCMCETNVERVWKIFVCGHACLA